MSNVRGHADEDEAEGVGHECSGALREAELFLEDLGEARLFLQKRTLNECDICNIQLNTRYQK